MPRANRTSPHVGATDFLISSSAAVRFRDHKGSAGGIGEVPAGGVMGGLPQPLPSGDSIGPVPTLVRR